MVGLDEEPGGKPVSLKRGMGAFGSYSGWSGHASRRAAGFTLLELLLVAAILSSLALAATAFVDKKDSQARFEETRNRLENIRRAVVGNPNFSASGEAVIGGFIADMGRLPQNLQELFEQGTLPSWKHDAATGLWSGWRGPYLQALPESKGQFYRDGWGNGGAAPGTNFGWNVTVTDIDGDATANDFDDALTVQSLGADGAPGGTGYAADYPPSGVALVTRTDHGIDLKDGIKVRFKNPGDGTNVALPATDTTLCLRIYHPVNGDIASLSSKSMKLTAALVPDGDTREILFEFPPAVTGTQKGQWVSWGEWAVRIFTYSSSCGSASSDAYPKAEVGPLKTVMMLPRTALPLIEWRME
jgi:prepilin-type N-terminal cleavage/methylation domain-containing protein